jgi:tetratricopeptide (TPR) repeat protein
LVIAGPACHGSLAGFRPERERQTRSSTGGGWPSPFRDATMMTCLRLSLVTAFAIAVSLASPLGAQETGEKMPKRPVLPADRDSNSAAAYYFYGISVLKNDPDKAAAAFYWATRVDPTYAPAYYGQHVALLLGEPEMALTDYLTRKKGALRDPMLRRADSLAYRALIKSPFIDQRLYGTVLSTWLERETGGETTVHDLGIYDRRFAAWAAYTRGEFPMAASIYRETIKRSPENAELRYMLALSYLGLGRPDSARIAVQDAIRLARAVEAETPGVGWSSHSFEEYGIGILYEMGGQADSARGAFERSLLDDVAFHPAHYHLARIRLAARDTAGALDEYGQAVTLAPTDAGYLSDLGMLLLSAGRTDSATAVFLKVATLEPYYALPHYPLGVVYEQSGFKKEAAEHYAAFLRLAPQTMTGAISAARARLAVLEPKPAAP